MRFDGEHEPPVVGGDSALEDFGASNKSTLGKILDRHDPNDRHEGNVAAHLWAAQAGAAMIRVHEPAKILPYLKITDAIRAARVQ